MKQIEEITIEVPHYSIAALSWGPKDGKPILALHGWLDNAASFLPLMPYLENFRFIAIDLPGHGMSSHLAQGAYLHLIDYVAHVVNIMDSLGWKKCSLLGHSLGAGVSSMVAGVIPERINELALIDGIGPITSKPEELPILMRNSIEEYSKSAARQPKVFTNKEDAINARLTASKMHLNSVKLLIERGLKTHEKGFTWRTDQRLLFTPLSMLTEDQVRPFLENITCPTTLLRPSPGWPYDEKIFNQRINYIKDISVHRIPGEHHVHMDHPELVGKILEDFFNNN